MPYTVGTVSKLNRLHDKKKTFLRESFQLLQLRMNVIRIVCTAFTHTHTHIHCHIATYDVFIGSRLDIQQQDRPNDEIVYTVRVECKQNKSKSICFIHFQIFCFFCFFDARMSFPGSTWDFHLFRGFHLCLHAFSYHHSLLVSIIQQQMRSKNIENKKNESVTVVRAARKHKCHDDQQQYQRRQIPFFAFISKFLYPWSSVSKRWRAHGQHSFIMSVCFCVLRIISAFVLGSNGRANENNSSIQLSEWVNRVDAMWFQEVFFHHYT